MRSLSHVIQGGEVAYFLNPGAFILYEQVLHWTTIQLQYTNLRWCKHLSGQTQSELWFAILQYWLLFFFLMIKFKANENIYSERVNLWAKGLPDYFIERETPHWPPLKMVMLCQQQLMKCTQTWPLRLWRWIWGHTENPDGKSSDSYWTVNYGKK